MMPSADKDEYGDKANGLMKNVEFRSHQSDQPGRSSDVDGSINSDLGLRNATVEVE